VSGDAVGVIPGTEEIMCVIPGTEEIMCPFCIGGVVLLAGSFMSAGGLTTLVVMKLGAKNNAKESVQKQNRKEETWVK
jgi:hypothetical protein